MDLRDRLSAALKDTYTIDRELGGGGMSSVFVAEQIALGRPVVLKVLPPELAAEISEERFRREVLLAARLQHPHIVPILSAGEADGLLYYTMPLVEGETLRSRLSREGELPVSDAIRVLSCVADAIAYAHSRGVVHRDIKPENILLTGQHAVVTDFGVAKALGAAASAPGLTGTGIAIGTAAYMAPEQVAADPAVDHRVDIYSLGIVAYELLAGTTPFSARSPQQLAAAHLTQQPEAITNRRAAVPAGLASLVMRCLEKRPADRPQTAESVARELSQLSTSGGQAAYRPAMNARRKAILAATAVVVAALAVFGLLRGKSSDAPAQGRRVVVAALTNETGDDKLESFGKMAADWVTQGLQETGFIDVVDSRTVLRASTHLSGGDAPVIEALAKQTTANLVVWGSYYVELDSLIVRAQVVNAADGKVLRTVSVGPVSRKTPSVALEALREKVLAALAPLVDPRLATWETTLKPPSYAAYQAYMDGLEAYAAQGTGSNMTRYDESAVQFGKAVALDSTFQTARLWQAFTYFLAGWTTEVRFLSPADSVIAVLEQHRSELGPSDRLFYNWFLALRQSNIAGTYSAAKEMMKGSPGSAYAIWESALAALRTNRPREAIELFERPQLTHGPSGALSLEAYAQWKANAFHIAGEYQKELQVARANNLNFTEARALIALGDTAAALSIIRRFLEPAGSGTTAGLAPLLWALQELRGHGYGKTAAELGARAIAAFDASTDQEKNQIAARLLAANIEYAVGHYRQAHAMLAELAALDSTAFPIVYTELNVQGLFAVSAARTGDVASALRISRELEERGVDVVFRPLGTYWRARIAAALGDEKNAAGLLRRAFGEGFLPVPGPAGQFLHSDPDIGRLLSKPEFREIAQPKG